MAAKTPIIMVSSTSIRTKYALTLRRGALSPSGPDSPSASFQDASTTTGIRIAVITIRTSAIPSAPTA